VSKLRFTVNCNNLVHVGQFEDWVTMAKEADELGYDRIRLIDHVVGFVAENHPEVEKTPYTAKSAFQEVFVLMGYLAAVTTRIGFITGVLALPQRQTALVAKQAAQVDIMSGGRLTLGIGIGYNSVEFQAMGASFKDRAPRVEEQIEVLRAFWTQDVVSRNGRWHDFNDVNVNPLPVQRPIPIWMGAGRMAHPVPPEKVLERIGKYADGFMPLFRIDDATGRLPADALAALDTVRRLMEQHSRDPATLGLEIGLWTAGKSRQQILDEIGYLISVGVTDVLLRLPDEAIDGQVEWMRHFVEIRDASLAQQA
jgi:probable F420-dependent oxidoreductase